MIDFLSPTTMPTPFEIADGDFDTQIHTSKNGVDDDILRFDIGNAEGTTYADLLKIGGNITGFIWNDGGNPVPFRFEGSGDKYLMYSDGSNDTVSFGTATTSITVNAVTVKPKVLVDRGGGDSNINMVLLSNQDAAQAGAFCVWARARGYTTSPTTYQAVQNGDRMGVFRNDAHDGTKFVTSGDFAFVVDGAVSTDIVPTKFAISVTDTAGNKNTVLNIAQDGLKTFFDTATSTAQQRLYADGGMRGNLDMNSSGTADLIWYGASYVNLFRVDVSANQVNIGHSSQGSIFSADGDTLEAIINKTNAGANLIVESSSAGVNLWETDTTNDIITQGTTVFTGRVQGLKGGDVASSSEITLGDGNYFDVTGTTTIDYITSDDWQEGSVVILRFDSALTIKHATAPLGGSTAPFRLEGSADFTTTAGDTLTLVYETGNIWREISRSVI